MKQYYFFLFCIILSAWSCKSSKTAEKITPEPNTRTYPLLSGYKVNSFTAPANKSEAEKSKLKFEIVAGKTVEVDCNDHVLTGDFEKRSMRDGYIYYVFNSDGNIVSTTKACPDNSLQTKFVKGPGLLFDYDNRNPVIVYTPNGIDARYRVWETSTSYLISQQVNTDIETEASKVLTDFPDSIKGYDRYVLILPPVQRTMISNDIKIEIIPGITVQTDCNNYRLIGNFKEVTMKEKGYRYFVFNSSGDYASLQKPCPNNDELKMEFITGETRMLEYISHYPIVIFVPTDKKFSVRYRIWESPRFAN
ncbi:MAG: hypothetical protein LBS52_03645 [Dysgonamonadaceae bacterium]|jgi:ecotin|nr:hypothetical protein [Dysgonamonadaceae bacterium]